MYCSVSWWFIFALRTDNMMCVLRNTHTHTYELEDWKQGIDSLHPSFSCLPLSTCCPLILSWKMFRRKQTFLVSFKRHYSSSLFWVFAAGANVKIQKERFFQKGPTWLNPHQRRSVTRIRVYHLSDAALICRYRPAASDGWRANGENRQVCATPFLSIASSADILWFFFSFYSNKGERFSSWGLTLRKKGRCLS